MVWEAEWMFLCPVGKLTKTNLCFGKKTVIKLSWLRKTPCWQKKHTDKTQRDLTTALLTGLELSPALQGNQVRVLVMEMDGGNYTCHRSNGEYLNHTLILIQLERSSRTVILEKKHPKGKLRRRMEVGAEGQDYVALLWGYQSCDVDADGRGYREWTLTLLLQVTSTARQTTTTAHFNARGRGRAPDPTLKCSW